MNWKKEYKVSDLFRDQDGAQGRLEQSDEQPVSHAASDANVWKKEIKLSSLFRRKKEPRQRALPQIGDTVAEGTMPTRSEEPALPESSMWKKEIKLSSLLRRRRQHTQPRPQLALPAPGDTLAEAPTGPVASHSYPSQPAPEPPVVPTPVPPQAAEPEQPAGEPAPAVPASAPGPDATPAPARSRRPLPSRSRLPPPLPSPLPPPPLSGPRRGSPSGRRSSVARRAKSRSAPRLSGVSARSSRRRAARAPERRPKGRAQLPQIPLMKALNLLPQDIKLPKTTVRPWVAYAAVGAVALLVAGGMGFLYLNETQHIADRESTLEDMEAQLAALEAEAAQAQADSADGSALAGEALTRATALSFALDGRRGWDRLLRELSLTLPDNVWFSSMVSAMSTPAPVLPTEPAVATTPVAPAPVTSSMTITGYALTQEDVAQLLARLEVVPEFSSIQLESATQTEIGEQSVIEFSVIGALKQPVQVTP